MSEGAPAAARDDSAVDGSVQTTADPGTYETAAFDAFAPFVNRTHTLRNALVEALKFAPVVRAEPENGGSSPSLPDEVVVIDKMALMLGLIAAGRDSEAYSSAHWLFEWLAKENADLTQLKSSATGRAEQVLANGAPILASRSLRSRVLPTACQFAQQTVARTIADARHILFALLEEPASSYGAIGQAFDGPKRDELKTEIVEKIAASPEEHENIDAWRNLIKVPPPFESVATLSDAPAVIDTLGRQAFAEVLATRIKQVSESLRSGMLGEDRAFILHIDGPWGSGKTSVLNFLKTNLAQSDPSWLIVEVNAWRNQLRVPAWWPIISHVGEQLSHLSWFQFPRARWTWLWWNLRMRWVPIAFSALLTGVFAFFAWRAVSGHQPQGMLDSVKDMVAGALALVTLAGLAWSSSRSIFFGSKNAAEAYVQSTSEPYRPIIRLFEHMIGASKPVAVFIDDLDRCDSSFVIDLLEGIQTLLRSAPVVYVVAGDRKWICSSFEKRYVDFCGEIGMPGRPLGYLFLDKVFQLSTAIPRLSTLRQAAYWKGLLENGDETRKSGPDEIKRLEVAAEEELKGKTSHEEIQKQIDRAKEGSLERETLRAAAAKQITSPEAIRAAEHRLQPLAGLLEPNPRAMKRLVNAYGLNHARAFLEGRRVEVEVLARWTIVELRWPLLAEYLATNWTDIAAGSLRQSDYPELIRALLTDSDVCQVFGRPGEKGRLTLGSLKPILE